MIPSVIPLVTMRKRKRRKSRRSRKRRRKRKTRKRQSNVDVSHSFKLNQIKLKNR